VGVVKARALPSHPSRYQIPHFIISRQSRQGRSAKGGRGGAGPCDTLSQHSPIAILLKAARQKDVIAKGSWRGARAGEGGVPCF
jgi:hypothetical protein